MNLKEEKLFESTPRSKITSLDEQTTTSENKIQKLETDVNNVKIDDTKNAPETSHISKTIVSKKIPDAPPNGYQFKKDWQFLGDSLDDLAAYFKVEYIF